MIASDFVGGVPFVSCNSAELVLKNEDVSIIYEPAKELGADPDALPWNLYAVCDGHQGVAAARFVEAHLWKHLEPGLPKCFPSEWSGKELMVFAEGIRRALISAIDKVDTEWYRKRMPSGSTVTVALVSGWLLSVANVGDSLSILHTGDKIVEMTRNHKLDDSPEEQARLRNSGVQLARLDNFLKGPAGDGEGGIGPLRAWPGGLAVSRAVGDADVSPHVIALPHVRQIMVPPEGARYLVASDGLWDRVLHSKIHRAVRYKSLKELPAHLMALVSRSSAGQLRDDATVIAVDILPVQGADFKRLAMLRQRARSCYPRWGHMWGGRAELDGLNSLLADEDGLLCRGFEPQERKETISFDMDNVPEAFQVMNGDFTVHGGKENLRGRSSKPARKAGTLAHSLPWWLLHSVRVGST